MKETLIRRTGVPSLALLALLAVVPAAHAAPIVYSGALTPGVTVLDSVPGTSTGTDPLTADYWSFFGTAGDSVTITGHRREANLDPGFWLFQGLFADTSAFGSNFDFSDPGFMAFRDDDIAEPFPGPFSDPQFVGTLPTTGFYTVAFVSVASGGSGDGVYDYDLVMRGATGTAPEPASILLLGAGVVGLAARRFRRHPAAK